MSTPSPPKRYSPYLQLVLSRVREFYREPEALFWVYGFPLIMVIALGIAFRERRMEKFTIDVETGPAAEATLAALKPDDRLVPAVYDAATCRDRLRTGKTDLIVIGTPPNYVIRFDPTKPENVVARDVVDRRLQQAAGRKDAVTIKDEEAQEPGGRYIDFLVPGLVGMSLMGGGLWGVGFVTVDMRIRKLLKRFLATPMKRSHFLLSIMTSRMLFMIPEVLIVLVFARLAFGVRIFGNSFALLGLIFFGSVMFSGIGLLLASRARTLEAISGLMNLFMLPMWILSGIFFHTERFPVAIQPYLRILPLTPLIHALRGVMLEAAPLSSLAGDLTIMVAWSAISFALALKWFRWS